MLTVPRHRTAMSRTFLSRPVQQAMGDGLLDGGATFFDYGCGRGGDIKQLQQLGYTANGWDPAHAPDTPQIAASVVNIGYVVNVIEEPSERRHALQAAWKLATEVLIVSARLDWEAKGLVGKPYGDGFLVKTGAFQKFYSQEELRAWIDSTLGVRSVAGAPGIYYVFRTPTAEQRLLARHARGETINRQSITELVFRQHEETLDGLAKYTTEHKRLPTPTDLSNADQIIETFGSIRAAFQLLKRASPSNNWADVDIGRPTTTAAKFEANLEILQPLIDFLTERGRLPRTNELDDASAIETSFGSIRDRKAHV